LTALRNVAKVRRSVVLPSLAPRLLFDVLLGPGPEIQHLPLMQCQISNACRVVEAIAEFVILLVSECLPGDRRDAY